jgi:elongation factor G
MAGNVRARGSEVAQVTPDLIRNVVLIGHAAAGKTTLIEALLVATGAISRAGRVEDGTTVSDHEEVEHRLGRSVALSVVSTMYNGIKINLVDTPGHADFVGEVRAGLRAADAALFVISAVDGVDGITRMLWEECSAAGKPRVLVITHLDQQRGDFHGALDTCRQAFGEGVQPLYLPVTPGDVPTAIIDLLAQTVHDGTSAAPAGPEHAEAMETARADLIEGIIQESEDDALLDRWLGGEDITVETLLTDLRTAVAKESFHPALPVNTPSGLGIQGLLDVICHGLPSPAASPVPEVTGPGQPLACDPSGPLVAQIVKTSSDPYVGRLSIARIFSGALAPDATVHVVGHSGRSSGSRGDDAHDVDERAGAVSAVQGATLTALDRGAAGDIVAVARLVRAETGDTLCDAASPALVEQWTMPEPLLPAAVTARSSVDEDKLSQGLSRLVTEDPTVRVEMNSETHQMVLWSMGEAHLEVLLDKLRRRHSIEVDVEPVKVALRETLAKKATAKGRHVKQSGGHGQYAVCDIEVEPLPEGSGFEFVDRVVGGAVPRQFIPSVEKGVRAQMDKGVAAGYPMVDLRVVLVGGKAHSVDSSDAAFQMAGSLALKEAAAAAGVAMLEPIDEVHVTVDDEYVGNVMGDLSSRRGRVTGTSSASNGRTVISAEIPEIELTRYATDLRSLAHGTGVFTRQYVRHAPMPQHQVEKVLAAEA